MVANFVNNQNSSKNQRANSTTFDIRNFIDQLNPVKEKDKYICPVCSGHNLSIDEKTGKYQCFNGCSCRDIREAIKPWASVVEERQTTTSSVSPKKPNTTPKAPLPHNKPVPIPAGELALARLAELPAAQPQPKSPQFTPKSVRIALLDKGVTEAELQLLTVITYDYGDNKASYRYQAPSKTSDKGYEKTFTISRVDSSGKRAWNKGNYAWAAYRQDEAIACLKAIDRDLIPVLLSHEGEKCVEAGRAEKLAGITSLGNSNEDDLVCILNEIKFKLDGRPFVLAHCQDNDKTGHEKAEKLAKACVRVQVPFVAIDLKTIYPKLCDKGDVVDILASGMTGDELAQVILEQIELTRNRTKNNPPTEETQWRYKRQNWEAPISWEGEIGKWVTIGTREDAEQKWRPLCNFDFQIEREIEDVFGGALVLQVKRCFEDRQFRVILNSTDFTKPDVFVDALKRAMGVGVVCNLTKSELSALIHTRLHEYRTTRLGRIFKRIDRYGQQEDGTWVFRDRQYKKDGTPTDENESGWVFNPSLGRDDYIPCPELAPPNPDALKQLVDSSRKFFGQSNINQVLLTMGWTVAGLHSQEINRLEGSFPLFNAHGEPGSCKTIASETALSIVGKNWGQAGMLARASVSALYEHGSRTGSLPFFWDDPDRNPENEELAKSWYNWKPRKVRGNEQSPHSPMGITSNHVFGGEQAATYTRFIRVPFERAAGGDKAAFQELKAAQAIASGAFALVIALGFPRDEIAHLEAELLQYLPHAHARIAQSLAIATWYAQKIVELTDSAEDIKQWVIDHCCKAENDESASGDSLKDFIDKILALEAESLVGDWNFRRQVERNGQQFYAIYNQDIWKLVDQKFKPATYNDKSLKALLLKAGGLTDTTARFSCDRDLVLAYKRALLTAGQTDSGEPIINSVKTLTRRAWLIPAELFDDMDEAATTATECNRNPVAPPNPDETSTSDSQNANCNCVTEKNEFKEKEKVEETSTGTQIINSVSTQNSGCISCTSSANQKSEVNQGFQAVTENPLQPVTPLQVGDKVRISHDLHPQRGAKLQVVRVDGNYLICEYLYGKKSGQTIPLEPREVEKI